MVTLGRFLDPVPPASFICHTRLRLPLAIELWFLERTQLIRSALHVPDRHIPTTAIATGVKAKASKNLKRGEKSISEFRDGTKCTGKISKFRSKQV
jgi:hypothetical protein